MRKKYQVGIIGATGYTGELLVKLLLKHSHIEIAYLGSESYSGKYYHHVLPSFKGKIKQKCKKANADEVAKNCDVVFFATPNDFANQFTLKLLQKNPAIILIDLSADFRLEKNIVVKRKSYKIAYGLPEVHRNQIKKSQIIANPGCYPTSIILALKPLLQKGLIDPASIICDSKSGTSGAGRNAVKKLKSSEIEESFSPYKLAGIHRHIPEIEQELRKLSTSKKKFNITFSPHLLPIDRGIISTVYADLKVKELTQKKLTELYKTVYKNEPFVKVLPSIVYPNVKDVNGSNNCHICPLIDKNTNRIIVVSCIDNMIKGASGQAIQNMNLILGINEKTSLT